MENANYGFEQTRILAHEVGRQVSLPILSIPDQFNKQYSQLWQFYESVRNRQSAWTSGSSYSNATIVTEISGLSRAVKAGNWKYVKKGYLSPMWRYITCEPAKINEKKNVFMLNHFEPKPHVAVGGAEVSSASEAEAGIITRAVLAGVPNNDWETVTRDYVTKLINIVRNPPEESDITVSSEPQEAWDQGEDIIEMTVLEEETDNVTEKEETEESQMLEPQIEEPDGGNQTAQDDKTLSTGKYEST